MSEEFNIKHDEAYEEWRITFQPKRAESLLIQAIDSLQVHDTSFLGKELTDGLIGLFESITGKIYEDAKRELRQDLIKEMIRLEKYTRIGDLDPTEKIKWYLNHLKVAPLFEIFKSVCEKTLG